jgi:hypothetical protein
MAPEMVALRTPSPAPKPRRFAWALALAGLLACRLPAVAASPDTLRTAGAGRTPDLHRLVETLRQRDSYRLAEAMRLRDSNRLAEASRLLGDLHARSPEDPSIARLYAETLAWSGRLDEARTLYAKLAAEGDSLSMLGLALTDAWRGDLARSAEQYEALAGNRSLRARALVGLAQVRFWQGLRAESDRLLSEASGLGPIGRDGSRLSRDLEADLSPRGLIRTRTEFDTDRNRFWMTRTGASAQAWRDLWCEALIGVGSTSRDETKYGLTEGEIGLAGPISHAFGFDLRGGVQHREPWNPSAMPGRTDRGFGSAALRAGGDRVRVGLRGEVGPLSNTPDLVTADIGLSAVTADLSAEPHPGLRADFSGTYGWFSDENERRSVSLGLHSRVHGGRPIVTLGGLHREVRNSRPGSELYFAPESFRSDQADVSVEQRFFTRHLFGFATGSIGRQRIDQTPYESLAGFLFGVEYRVRGFECSIAWTRSDSAFETATGNAWNRITAGVRVAL